MFPLIFDGTVQKKVYTCSIMNFDGNLGAQNFVAYFKKAIKLYKFLFIVVQAKRNINIFTDRLCLMSTFKMLFYSFYFLFFFMHGELATFARVRAA